MGEDFSDVNDDFKEYMREIQEMTPSADQRLVEGGLRQRGYESSGIVFRKLFKEWIRLSAL